MARIDRYPLDARAAIEAGDPQVVEDLNDVVVEISGTFSATIEVQAKLLATSSSWVPIGTALTAAGRVQVGLAHSIRVSTTAYTSGTPAGAVAGLTT